MSRTILAVVEKIELLDPRNERAHAKLIKYFRNLELIQVELGAIHEKITATSMLASLQEDAAIKTRGGHEGSN